MACAWEATKLKEALRGVFEPALKQMNKKLRENLGTMRTIFNVVQFLDYCQEDATRNQMGAHNSNPYEDLFNQAGW
jgi:hypothetical protein